MKAAAQESRKENFVLVSSFFANSLLLQGLITYLSRYFQVHFIDLPGFINSVPPLSQISVENFTAYVNKRIEDLRLKSYYLGGISFGFLVVNNLVLDRRCQGIVAIAPYINGSWLRLSLLKKFAYTLLVNLIVWLNLSSKLWGSRFLQRAFHWYSDYPGDRINHLLHYLDGRTFFKTAQIILNRRRACSFQDRPHVLIISRADRTISNYPLYKLFSERIKELKVVKIAVDHYPLDMSEGYFRERFPEDAIREIMRFFHSRSSERKQPSACEEERRHLSLVASDA